MSLHHDLLRERTLDLLANNGQALGSVDDLYRRDPDLVLAALKDCPEAIRYASPELLQDRGFALEVAHRAWRALDAFPERLRGDPAVALAAARRGREASALPAALALVPEPLRGDRAFRAAAEAPAPAAAAYEGESLRLVGYCNKWKLTDSKLRFRRLRHSSDPHEAKSPVNSSEKVSRHCLTVDLQEGCLSFQVISCARTFAFRIFPDRPGKDGFFTLAPGSPSAVAAVAGGDDGHGHNFYIREGPQATVTIYVDVAEGPVQGEGSIAVWYDRGRKLGGGQQVVPLLSQATDRQKPKHPKKKMSPPPKPAPRPESKPEAAKPPSSPSPGPGSGAPPTTNGEGEVTILPDVGSKTEYADLVLEARTLSKKTFDKRFYLRDLIGNKHLTLIVNDMGSAGKKFLGYCMCDGMFPDRCVWIDHLAILAKERRKGLGKQLIRWAGMWALAGGCEALRLSALPTAVPFYEALGFQLLPPRDQRDKDMFRMELKLGEARELLWGIQ